MKNLALIAAVAAIAIPSAANAAEPKMEKQWYDGASTINFEVQQGAVYNAEPFIPREGQTMTLDLVNGGQLMLDGRAAYIIGGNGNKYLANNAPHKTTAGVTYQTHDGEVLYATPSSKMYTFVADARDTDNDGYADDVDFTIQ